MSENNRTPIADTIITCNTYQQSSVRNDLRGYEENDSFTSTRGDLFQDIIEIDDDTHTTMMEFRESHNDGSSRAMTCIITIVLSMLALFTVPGVILLIILSCYRHYDH